MAGMNLDKMSVEELKALRKDVDKAIVSYEERQRKDALAAVEAKAREMGFSLAELTGGGASRPKKAPLPPKYAHPENPSLTWSGRGRQPGWIKEALADGKSLDEFAIKR